MSYTSYMKIKNETDKYILRKVSEKVLPREISGYKKRGFVTPIRRWMADEQYNQDIKMVFSGETVKQFFNVAITNEWLDEFIRGNQQLWRKIWTVYAYVKWYDSNF